MNVSVGEIAAQLRGVTYAKDEASTSPKPRHLPILRANNITEWGLQFADLVFVPESRVTRKQLLRQGDVVVAASSGSLDVVGKAAQLVSRFEGSFGAFCKVLRPDDSRVDTSYFAHYFRTSSYRQKISALAAGANINNLKNEHLDNLEIPLPPLPEQRRIAAILDKADALRRKRQRTIDLLDSLTQSIFLEMFGDPVINPLRWPQEEIGAVCTVVTGNTPPRSDRRNYGDLIEWIKSDNIDPSRRFVLRASEYLSAKGKAIARTAPAGAILVTCIAGSPGSIGNAAQTDREVAFNQQINALIPKHIETDFLRHQISVGKRLVQGASTNGMKGLVSKSRLEAVLVICPPIKMQREYAAFVAQLAKLKASQDSDFESAQTLFASLQHRAFSGQL